MWCPVGPRGALLWAMGGLFIYSVPCAWAQDGGVAGAAPQSSGLDPQSPLAPMPGLGVDWPDLDAAPPEPVDPAAQTEMTGESRYSYRIDGMDSVTSTLLHQRFARVFF